MVFDRLARTVTKRYKLIIAIWVIALLVSIPAMMSLNNVVSYNSTMSSGGDTSESGIASEIITENFQTSVANSTLIIVLQSDNMTDAAARGYVLALQQGLGNANISFLESVTSIYSYSAQVMYLTITELGPQMYAVEAQVNQSAFLLWGIPAVYVQNWAGYYASDANETNATAHAYSATNSMLSTYLAGMDANTTAMAMGYYNAFAATWNYTASNMSLVSDPTARGEYCVGAVAPTFINGLPLTDTTKQVMTAVMDSFNMSTFDNQPAVHAFTLGMISSMAGISNMTFLQETYDLGLAYDTVATYQYAQSIVSSGTLQTYPVAMPEQLVSGFVSPSNQTMLMMLSFSVASDYISGDGSLSMTDLVGEVRSVISGVTESSGYDVTTYVTGMAAISADMKNSSISDMSLIEPITIIVILVLMGYLFRTVVGQFLPLGAVGVAIGVSQAMVFVLASTIMDVNYMISTMLFAILMGVGTDYSIFIVTRYREERIKGAKREEAVHTALVWAGESVATSASTVIIAFLAMATADFSFVQTMGLIMSGAIVIALLVALTLIPSILMLVGNRIFWPTTGARWERFANKVMERKKAGNYGYFHKAATFSVKHAKMVLVVAILVTVPTAYLFVTVETSFDFIGVMGNSESIEGMKSMTEDFGAGSIEPTQIVIAGDTVIYDGTNFNYAYLDAVDNITVSIAAQSEVQKVTGITRPYGELIDYRNLTSLPDEEREQIVSSMLSSLGTDNKSVLLTVILTEEPQSSGSVRFIKDLRGELAQEKEQEPMLSGSEILVGGTTAALYDTSKSTSAEFTNIEILVVIGIFIVLMLVLGSILLPAFAVLSIAMSITWAFALVNLVFGSWLGLPVLWLIPLILFVMLMGIGIDYNVFILTRIREEFHKGKEIKEAVVSAVDWTGGIITALAVIMVGAFGALMLSSNAMLQEFGFALSVAVLLDAMVVRTYIVPAALTVMGNKAWWAPGRLQREGREEKMRKKAEKRSKTD